MVYMSAKPMSVELKQFVSLTRPILGSPGSAKMMSTHWVLLDFFFLTGYYRETWGGNIQSIKQRRVEQVRQVEWLPCRRL